MYLVLQYVIYWKNFDQFTADFDNDLLAYHYSFILVR